MHMSSKLRRTAVSQMNRASVIPENQIVILPLMPINKAGLGAVTEKKLQ